MREISETLVKPFPITQTSHIINGFGRGSSDLGIPTANIPICPELNDLEPGIYFGWCQLSPVDNTPCENKRADGTMVEFNYGKALQPQDLEILPMVMSIGFNPFYNNKEKAAEIHIMHKFSSNFYGSSIKFVIGGYVRPELDYTTKEALIEDINEDIRVSLKFLNTEEYLGLKSLF
ncbi:riboflavin kinase [[Candida] jaroonii]|uniref:Riboflavin kinase n=1 Tax=[Candida] jaroonii TaxID=467808 RepID=A0ACA9Y366_9ASCO|nr:riboflavin kinase [[Candida] jaroonii]